MMDISVDTEGSSKFLSQLSSLVKQGTDQWIPTFAGGAVVGPDKKIQTIKVFTPGFDSPICKFFQKNQGDLLKALKETNELLKTKRMDEAQNKANDKRMEKIKKLPGLNPLNTIPKRKMIQQTNHLKVDTPGSKQLELKPLQMSSGVLIRNVKVTKGSSNKFNVTISDDQAAKNIDLIKEEVDIEVELKKEEYFAPNEVESLDPNLLKYESTVIENIEGSTSSDFYQNASEEIITGDLSPVMIEDNIKKEKDEYPTNKTLSEMLENPDDWIPIEGAPYKLVSRLEEALFFPDKVEIWRKPWSDTVSLRTVQLWPLTEVTKDKSVLYRGNWITPVEFASKTGSSISLESISVAYDCMKLDKLIKTPKLILQEIYIESGMENDPNAPIFKVIRANRAMVAKVCPYSKLSKAVVYDPDTQKIEIRGLHRNLVFAKNVHQIHEADDKTGKVKVLWIRSINETVLDIPKSNFGPKASMVPLCEAPYKVKCNSLEALLYPNKLMHVLQKISMVQFLNNSIYSSMCILYKSKWMTPKDFQNLSGNHDACYVVFEGIQLEEFLSRSEEQRHITFYIEKGKESSANTSLCKFTNVGKHKKNQEELLRALNETNYLLKSKMMIWKYSPASNVKVMKQSSFVKYHPDSKVINRNVMNDSIKYVKATNIFQVQNVDPDDGTVEIEWIRFLGQSISINGALAHTNNKQLEASKDKPPILDSDNEEVIVKPNAVVVVNPDDFSDTDDEGKMPTYTQKYQTHFQKMNKMAVQTFPIGDAPYKIVLGDHGAFQALLFKNKSIPWSQTHLYRCVLYLTDWMTIDQFLEKSSTLEKCYVINEFGKQKIDLQQFIKKQLPRDFWIEEGKENDPNSPIYKTTHSNIKLVKYLPKNTMNPEKVSFDPNFCNFDTDKYKSTNIVKVVGMFQKHTVHALNGNVSIEWIRHIKHPVRKETIIHDAEQSEDTPLSMDEETEELTEFPLKGSAKIETLKDSPDLVTFNETFALMYHPKRSQRDETKKLIYFNGISLTLDQFKQLTSGHVCLMFFQSISLESYLQDPIEKKFFVKRSEQYLSNVVLYSHIGHTHTGLKGHSECWEYEPDLYKNKIVGYKDRIAVDRPKQWKEYVEAVNMYQIHREEGNGEKDLQWIRVMASDDQSLDIIEKMVKGVTNFDDRDAEIKMEEIKLEPEDDWDKDGIRLTKRKGAAENEASGSSKKLRQ